jgi:site-specific recombinase XerD
MLNVPDIDFEEMTIFVRHGKRSKQRLVPLHAEIAAALGEYLGDRRSGAVFLSNRGNRISLRRLRSLIKDLAQKAGLKKDVHPHSLRHTFAVSIREAGEELDVLKDLLGHASIETTEIYTHCSVSQLRAAVDRI